MTLVVCILLWISGFILGAWAGSRRSQEVDVPDENPCNRCGRLKAGRYKS